MRYPITNWIGAGAGTGLIPAIVFVFFIRDLLIYLPCVMIASAVLSTVSADKTPPILILGLVSLGGAIPALAVWGLAQLF